MLMYMFIMNWMMSMIFMFLNHPLSLGCVLLMQTIIISLSSGMFYYNFWFSYILFLIMVGGMLVMFIYMTSIASNEKFKIPKKMLLFIMSTLLLCSILIITMDNFYSSSIYMNLMMMNQSMEFYNITLNKFFNQPNMQMMIILMIYLLITLIATVKIAGKNLGTLRQK
uniref:NADH-ubiquinone oxidoreductase chain 6 n=1 Tax=Elaeidobius kamerunicus TaxID=2663966 RepID=A0A7D5YNQ8_9CUCU|nr:NADH dehydrogenase subunit 6 [Elaeidobius kamerunicus]QLI52339.1 NADH dehydrogenase subunit 6 [Elaeidobius kamerunicus]